MTKLIASVLAALALVACSDDAPASDGPAPVNGARDISGDPAGAASASTNCPDQAAKSAERKVPTTFEACEGYWDCNDIHRWMRPVGETCTFGVTTVLFADGRVTDPSFGDGTWRGDAFYVTLNYADDADGKSRQINCIRLPNEPSH